MEKDLKEAVKYYRLSADQGNVVGTNQLRCLLSKWPRGGKGFDGSGGVLSFVSEIKEMRMAQISLGWCYHNGEGVEKDLKEAVKYYRLSADQGNADAKTKLETLLKNHPHLRYQQATGTQTQFFASPDQGSSSAKNTQTYGGPAPGF